MATPFRVSPSAGIPCFETPNGCIRTRGAADQPPVPIVTTNQQEKCRKACRIVLVPFGLTTGLSRFFLGETNRRHKHRESAHATGSPVRETPWKRRVNSASGQRIRGAYDSTWKVGWSTSVLFASSPEIQGPLQEPEAAALRGLQCLQRSSGPEAMDPE